MYSTPSTKRFASESSWSKYRLRTVHRSAPLAASLTRTIGPTQAEFVCRRCGHTDNADHNAAVVITRRGVTKILSGVPLTKPKKTVRMRKTVGPERSKPVQSAQKPGETEIRHDAGDPCVAHKSMIQETPAAIPETPTTARSA